MAKKVRRVKKVKNDNMSASVEDVVEEKMPASSPTPTPAPRKTKFRPGGRRHTPTEAEMREEYAYVIKDLRRVFFLAAAMFVLLVVLNIVLG